jgi:hypothetical protein
MDPPIRIRIHTKMSWIRKTDSVFVVQACAEKVGQVQVDCGLLQPVGDYVESFNFGLVEVSCLRTYAAGRIPPVLRIRDPLLF